MKKVLAWIMIVCSLLVLIPAGILVYMNGWANGLGFGFVMGMPPFIVGVLLLRQPFPRNMAIVGILLSLAVGGIFTWYAKKEEHGKLSLPADPGLKKSMDSMSRDSSK